MKNLAEYIQNKSIHEYFFIENYIESIINPFYGSENNYPHNIESLVELNIDIIDENLKSHNYNTLINKIQNLFNKDIDYIDIVDSDNNKNDNVKSFFIKGDKAKLIELSKTPDFISLLTFFNYNIVAIKPDGKMYIEPLYPTYVDLEKSHNIVYHFTTIKNAKSILKNGLRPKRSLNGTRPERVYCYYNKPTIDEDAIPFILSLFSKSEIKYKGLSILKIDLNKNAYRKNYTCNFYEDTLMKVKGAVFTLNNIPKEYISEITIPDNIYNALIV